MIATLFCAWRAGMPFDDVARDGEKLARVIYEAYRDDDYDMVLVFSDPYVEAQALGCAVEFSPGLKLLGPSSRLVETIAGKEAAEKVVLQYGGSVKPENAKALLGQPDIDGALVGGACLKADSFVQIIRSGV